MADLFLDEVHEEKVDGEWRLCASKLYNDYKELIIGKYMNLYLHHEKKKWVQLSLDDNKLPYFRKIKSLKELYEINELEKKSSKLFDLIIYAFEKFDLNLGSDEISYLTNAHNLFDIDFLECRLNEILSLVNFSKIQLETNYENEKRLKT